MLLHRGHGERRCGRDEDPITLIEVHGVGVFYRRCIEGDDRLTG
jgi:hypothetical protein